MAHSEAEWPSQHNILLFIFSYFIIFLVLRADVIPAEPSPETLQLGASCLCKGVGILKIYI